MAHQCNQLGLGHLAELHTCQRAARGGHGQGEEESRTSRVGDARSEHTLAAQTQVNLDATCD
jgi:hypothetical protein